MKPISALAPALLVLSSLSSFAAPGAIDPTFDGGKGLATNIIGTGQMISGGLALQPDGKILGVGAADLKFCVIRYQANGTLDSTFAGGTGYALTSFGSGGYFDNAHAVALQTDGSIVVIGESSTPGHTAQDLAVVRYLSDGTLDPNFGTAGKVTTDVSATYDDYGAGVAIQTDQKIVVAGTSYLSGGNDQDFTLVRYKADGTLDTTFAGTGKVLTDFGGFDTSAAVAIQPDGKILQVGTNSSFGRRFAVVRYQSDGTLDTTFGGTGKVTTDPVADKDDYGQAIAIQSNGKIVVGGSAYTTPNASFELVRYNSDGTLDTTFGKGGIVITDSKAPTDCGTNNVLIDSAGRILIAGYVTNGTATKFAILRYTSSGQLDATFGTAGIALSDPLNGGTYLGAAALDSAGKLVAFGTVNDNSNPVLPTSPFAIARYLTANGAPVVKIKGPTKIKTTAATVSLKGTATDDVKVAKVLVSGKAATGTASWSYKAKLKIGMNKFKITAVDGNGLASAPVNVTVTRSAK